MTQTRESVRAVRWHWLDDLWLDVRHATRLLRRAPAFSLTAVTILALGIGGTVAIFSVINAVLFRPLAVRAPSELVYIYQRLDNGQLATTEFRDLEFLRPGADVFTGVTAHTKQSGAVLSIDGAAARVGGEMVAANYFEVLGVRAAIGRMLRLEEDDVTSPELGMVISHDFWTRQFQGDPSVLGRTIALNGHAFVVVGVAEVGFRGVVDPWSPSQFWVTATQYVGVAAPNYNGGLIGRLRPGMTAPSAQAIVSTLADRAQREHEFTRVGSRTIRAPVNPYVLRAATSVTMPFAPDQSIVPMRLMIAVMVVAGLVLVIAAANIAGVLLSRGVTRAGELAVRRGLGAGASRIARHLLTESLVLSLVSGAVGLGLARIMIALYSVFAHEGTLIASPFDARVVLFTLAVCLATGVLVGLAPARQALRVDVVSTLGGGTTSTAPVRRRLRHLVVVPQVSLALVLLLAAGVYTRVLLAAETNPLGYRTDRDLAVMTVELETARRGVLNMGDTAAVDARMAEVRARATTFHRNLDDTFRRLPNITAAVTAGLPLYGPASQRPTVVTHESLRGGQAPADGPFKPWRVSLGFFRAMGIGFVRGRDFDDHDTAASTPVVVITAALADRLWPGENPIGRSLAFGGPATQEQAVTAWFEVVGVVNDIRSPLDSAGRNVNVFAPVVQTSDPPGLLMIVARANGGQLPPETIEQIKHAITSADPLGLTDVFDVTTMERLVGDLLYQRRMAVGVLASSGIAGLLLALIGLYGVISYSVEQRRREIGIRAALGADRRDLIGLVLREGLQVTAIGSVVGLALSFWALRLASGLVGLAPKLDALTFVVVPFVVLPTVLLACYLPARRAAKVDPLAALRQT